MSTQSKMTEHADRRIWNLESYEVTYLHIDDRFAFDCLHANNQLTVVIEIPFELRRTGQTILCNPTDVNSLKEAISILHKRLNSLTAFRDGRLLLTFLDGTEISVSRDPQCESWEVRGEGELENLAFLCSPHEGPPWKE